MSKSAFATFAAVTAMAALLWAVVATRAEAAGMLSREEALTALDDLGTRLQFDFYAADDLSLQRDLGSLRALEVPSDVVSLKHVYAGFGAWKRAELLRVASAAQAGEFAQNCITELDRAIELEPRRGALLAMLARCERLVADLQGRIKAPRSAGRARQNLKRASQLAPRDPHVLLIEGITEFERWRLSEGDLSIAHAKLKSATAAFEAALASATMDTFATAMSWGPAEAWNMLGQVEVELNNVAAARDAFERALVIVGDYPDVQLRLRGLTAQ